MPIPDRGSVWIVDLGMMAKVRPALVLSIPTGPVDRVLATVIPRTSSIHGTEYEVPVPLRFLKGAGVFDAQQLVTIPQVKLIRKLGTLKADQLAAVETAVKKWLGLIDRNLP